MKNSIHSLAPVKSFPHRNTRLFSQNQAQVIKTADGKIIAIDGGHYGESEAFLEYLRTLTGEEIPHIDAWLLTHPHDDHIEVFCEIMDKHPDAVTVDKIYYNFPSAQFCGNYGDQGASKTTATFYSLLPRFAEKIVITSVGDVYDIGDAHVEILYSPDPYITQNVCNNTSVVYKITLGGKVILILGDCGVEAGRRILARFGADGVKCDICQMAHHGQNGCDRAFYEAARPEVCLWCAPDWLWDNDAGDGFNTHIYKTVEVRSWMEALGTVKENLVTKDGTQVYSW